jgi:hypothetical protein
MKSQMTNLTSGILPSEIILKAWDNKGYEKKLKENPRKILMEEGYNILSNTQVIINSNKTNCINFTLPKKSKSIQELSEVEMSKLILAPCANTGTCS